MTNAQFGLLTSGFLWVYGFCSPLGGFVADKFGRRLIILISVLVWSVVTWYTGHTHSFAQLLWARALMGISEACYVPAALALISNHHRGSTRSLATGLHNTGMYVGAGLGGLGGYLASHYGWRFGFSILGVFGVVYALVAALLLKDADSGNDRPNEKSPAVNLIPVFRALLTNGAFWLLTAIFCLISIANWFAYGWMPSYLRDHFNLSQGAAGLSATGYIQAATFVGVIGGGIWADRWSVRQPRARQWVAAVGFALAAPAFFMTGTSSVLGVAILGLLLFGISRGFFDSNSMPILRQIAPENYSATGYGFMNLCGCFVGGLITYASGALLDSKGSLEIVFEGIAIGMACGAVGLAVLQRRKVAA